MPTINVLGKSERGMDTFLTHKSKNAKKSSLRIYTNHIGIARKLSPKPLLDLNEEGADNLASELSKKKSGSTVASTVRAFYRFHGKSEVADRFKIRRHRKRLSPKSILTVEEIQKMIDVTPSLRDKSLIVVLYESAGRIHEVLALDLSDITKKKARDRIYYELFFKKVKVEGEEHCSYIVDGSSYLGAWINAHPLRNVEAHNAPLFPRMDRLSALRKLERLGTGGARFIIKAIAKKAGIKKNVYPHLFRHSRITHLSCQLNEPQVKKAVGLTPSSTELDRYSHLANKDIENALLKAYGLIPETATKMEHLHEILKDIQPEPIIIERTSSEVEEVKKELEELKEVSLRNERRFGAFFQYFTRFRLEAEQRGIESPWGEKTHIIRQMTPDGPDPNRFTVDIASWVEDNVEGNEEDKKLIKSELEKFERERREELERDRKRYWEERSRTRDESK